MSLGTERSPPDALKGRNKNDTKWLLRRVWDRVNRDNEHFMGCIVGREGSGKSYTALKIASMLDETFNADRVIFDVIDMLEILTEREHDPGNFYVLDEAGVQLGNRTWQERSQVLANQALQLIRSHNLGLVFTLPRGRELDEQAYARQQALIEMTKKQPDEFVRAKWQWIDPDRKKRDGKIYYHNPRRRENGQLRVVRSVGFTPPEDEELIETYEENKEEFQHETYEKTIKEARGETDEDDDEPEEMGPREIATEIANNGIEKYADRNDSNGQPYINPNLIRVDYDLSQTDAQTVKSLLARQYDKNEIEQYAPARA